MLYAIVVLLILIGDQAVKLWTSQNIPFSAANTAFRNFIPGVQLTNVHNSGAAFGILKDADARWLFIILAIAFVALVVWLLRANVIKGKFGRWMLVMVMAGGLGNCFDRIVSGYVVDMFSFTLKSLDWFPVFNVADIFISVCGILFCIYLLRNRDDLSDKNLAEVVPRPPVMPRRGEEPDPLEGRVDYIAQLSHPVVEGKKNIEAEKLAREFEQSEPQISVGPGNWVTPPEDLNTPTRREVQAAKKEPRANPFEELNASSVSSADKFFAESAPETPAQPEAPKQPDLVADAAPKAPEKPAVDDLFAAAPPAKPKKDEGEYSVDDIIAEFKDK